MAMLTVHSPSSTKELECLAYIDTGAKELTLPADIALEMSILCSPADAGQVVTASGEVLAVKRAIVDVTVKGKRAKVWASFGDVRAPLIGVTTIKKVMTLGVDRDGWLHQSVPPQPLPWPLRLLAAIERMFS